MPIIHSNPAVQRQSLTHVDTDSDSGNRKAISNAKARAEEAEAAKKPKHEDWMTQLPTVGPFTQTVDEMGKNRTFSRKEKEGRGDTSEWTDTPADKVSLTFCPFSVITVRFKKTT